VRAGPTPSGITPKLHDHRSVSLLRLQRYCLFPFPPNFSASFFAPFFNFFSQSPIYQRVIRTKKIAGHSSRMPAIPFISRI
uniref:hypothetical protein n=1 Tax=Candidatus Limisoma sp. TaxID=3076476 RepID=UPI003FEEE272